MMTRRNAFARWAKWLALGAAMLTGVVSYAQQPPPGTDTDPPVRVGRISYMNGDVSFSPAGNDEWVRSRLNRPIVAGGQNATAIG